MQTALPSLPQGAIQAAEANQLNPALQSALDNAKPTPNNPNQLMTTLEDGTRIIFRKNFGVDAHPLGGPFQGQGKIDHYNIGVQIPREKGGVKITENIHIVPDSKGGFTW